MLINGECAVEPACVTAILPELGIPSRPLILGIGITKDLIHIYSRRKRVLKDLALDAVNLILSEVQHSLLNIAREVNQRKFGVVNGVHGRNKAVKLAKELDKLCVGARVNALVGDQGLLKKPVLDANRYLDAFTLNDKHIVAVLVHRVYHRLHDAA